MRSRPVLFAKASTAEREALRLACEQDLLAFTALMFRARMAQQIGRASCRERVYVLV